MEESEAQDPPHPKETIEKEGLERLRASRMWKALWNQDLREAYFFASPQRQRVILSYSVPPMPRPYDAGELNTDIAFELCGDFATEVINTYMPEAGEWCERGPGEMISAEAFKQIEKKVRDADKQVFVAIKASNFYAELSKAFDPDLSIGTVALWIHRPFTASPIVVSAVPIHEFEINLGPYGEIDDRFAVRHTRNSYVETLLGKDIWNAWNSEAGKAAKAKMADNPAQKTQITWGFWRLWDETGDVCWQHVVYVGKELVHDVEIKGDGCCPLLVFRWNPNPDWPWGHGPLMQYLPSLRQIDDLEVMRTEHTEMAVRPPYGYPDDSFAAIEQGLEPGMGYPIRPGSEGAIKPIVNVPPPDASNYLYEEKEHRLRKGFYVDFPQQSGDTPPTLGQWLDEMARAQRRIGRPGLPFFREGPAQIFIRFKYLLEQAGAIQPIEIDGKTIALMPFNPAQRAAEQQEIAMAVHGLQLCAQFWPEEFKALVDGGMTMKALLAKLRVELVKFRDAETVNAAIDQISKLMGGQQPGAQGAGQIPGGQAA